MLYYIRKRPVGQAAKTPPSHGGDGGSIPPRVTKAILNKVPKKSSFLGALAFLNTYADNGISFYREQYCNYAVLLFFISSVLSVSKDFPIVLQKA